MSKNKTQQSRTLTISPVPVGGVASGDLLVIGAAVGVAQSDGLEGSTVEADVEGCFALPKTAGEAVGFGQKLYLVSTTGLLSTTASGNTAVGYASRAAGAG